MPSSLHRWSLLALLALPAPASAQSIASCAEGPAAHPVGGSPCRSLSIAAVAVSVACTERDSVFSCAATLDATFTSVGDVAIPLPMAELVRDPASTITVDGAPWSAADAVPSVAPGRSLALRVTQTVQTEARTINQYTGTPGSDLAEMPPLRVRHFVVAEPGAGTRTRIARVVLPWPDFLRRSLGWRAVATPEIDLDVPSGWALHETFDVIGFTQSAADVVTNGGPVLTAGGTFDRGARVGVGYEFGFAQGPTAIVIGAHGELVVTDTLRYGAALHVELATPGIGVILPSFSAGVGLVVEVAPQAHAGFRAIGTITWPFVGTSIYVDVYDDGIVEVSLMGRVSI